MKPIKWVKVPAPGQFRGEGEWKTLAESGYSEAVWLELNRTQFLPTAEQIERPA